MTIKSDRWIKRMALEHGMIQPFEPSQVRTNGEGRIVSYGVSSYGYDVRCADEFKIFTNINTTIVDPKHFDEKSFVDFRGACCIIPPNSFALARTVEYFRVPENVLVLCVGKSTYARCFRGDTRVALVDGTAPTLEEMARRHETGELFWGYSIGAHGRLICTLLDAPRFIGRDSLLEVTLDHGQCISATPDHLFLTRDGRMVPARSLRSGDSLMPLYRKCARGYEMVYQPLDGHLYPTHRLADEWNLRNEIYEAAPRTHRHHVDFDRKNNKPTNITRLPASQHLRLHNAHSYGDDFDPQEHGQSISLALKRLRADPIWRARFSEAQAARASSFRNDDRYSAMRARLIEQRRNPSDATRHAHRMATLNRYVRVALDETGPIRGAARLLDYDRTVFRRFPEVIESFTGRSTQRNHKIASIRELPGEHDVYCLTVPEAGNFALDAGVFVRNCGVIVNVTPLEPGWEGQVTLEFSNTTPLPAKIYANEGVAQMLFLESDEVCETSYKDRAGKYMGQRGVTLPKT